VTTVRQRLLAALRTDATLPALRESLIHIAASLGTPSDVPTVRSIQTFDIDVDVEPLTESDTSPSIPVDSSLGREFGP
jgi:hypothetical protein